MVGHFARDLRSSHFAAMLSPGYGSYWPSLQPSPGRKRAQRVQATRHWKGEVHLTSALTHLQAS